MRPGNGRTSARWSRRSTRRIWRCCRDRSSITSPSRSAPRWCRDSPRSKRRRWPPARSGAACRDRARRSSRLAASLEIARAAGEAMQRAFERGEQRRLRSVGLPGRAPGSAYSEPDVYVGSAMDLVVTIDANRRRERPANSSNRCSGVCDLRQHRGRRRGFAKEAVLAGSRPTAASTCRPRSSAVPTRGGRRFAGSRFKTSRSPWRSSWPATSSIAATVEALVRDALNFPVRIVELEKGLGVVELFHGPTFAFKDFGARTLARLGWSSLKRPRRSHSPSWSQHPAIPAAPSPTPFLASPARAWSCCIPKARSATCRRRSSRRSAATSRRSP